MVRVGVLGAAGRMGLEVCRAVTAADDLELVAAVDTDAGSLAQCNAEEMGTEIGLLSKARAEVAVDFTVADAALSNMRWCAEQSVHCVVGTTGISSAALVEMGELFASSGANAVVAPNFAIGAVLMMRFSELAASFMDGVEIIELHHDAKRDAPSGTAMETARRLDEARRASGAGPWAADPTTSTVVGGARGGEAPGGVHIHSVRLPGLVAHQEVVFGATGQSLTLRHDAYDRSSFMPGVLLAVRNVAAMPGLTVGLDSLLGF